MEVMLTTKGDEVKSEMTDNEVAHILGNLYNKFPRSLANTFAKYGKWTAKQRPWAHKLAVDSKIRRSTAIAANAPDKKKLEIKSDFQGTTLIEMFDTAAEHLKRPSITFRGNDPKLLRISRVASGPNNGCLNISNAGRYGSPDNIWYGRITRDGIWESSGKASDKVTAFLGKFAADPKAIAEKYGKDSGFCCFCNRLLTDERSTAVGYGPVCAGHYRMPWGK